MEGLRQRISNTMSKMVSIQKNQQKLSAIETDLKQVYNLIGGLQLESQRAFFDTANAVTPDQIKQGQDRELHLKYELQEAEDKARVLQEEHSNVQREMDVGTTVDFQSSTDTESDSASESQIASEFIPDSSLSPRPAKSMPESSPSLDDTSLSEEQSESEESINTVEKKLLKSEDMSDNYEVQSNTTEFSSPTTEGDSDDAVSVDSRDTLNDGSIEMGSYETVEVSTTVPPTTFSHTFSVPSLVSSNVPNLSGVRVSNIRKTAITVSATHTGDASCTDQLVAFCETCLQVLERFVHYICLRGESGVTLLPTRVWVSSQHQKVFREISKEHAKQTGIDQISTFLFENITGTAVSNSDPNQAQYLDSTSTADAAEVKYLEDCQKFIQFMIGELSSSTPNVEAIIEMFDFFAMTIEQLRLHIHTKLEAQYINNNVLGAKILYHFQNRTKYPALPNAKDFFSVCKPALE